ncbi:MAG: CHAT domain-containing protein [Bryobacteraceae bacterium]|nr:CHAT domain-containing protein [Bryobacteraceae bacterium]
MSSLANMRYRQAIHSFSDGAALAKRVGDPLRAQRFLNALGGSYLTVYQYRKALNVYEEARGLARQNRAAEIEAVVDLNLASLYMLLWDVDSAQRELDAARRRLPVSSRYWAALYADQSYLALRTGDGAGLERAALAGLDAADAMGNTEVRAALAEDLGLLAMQRGRLAQAEDSLLEAYRLRRLAHLRDIEPVLCSLSRLALWQGQAERAVWLAKLARASRSYSASSASPWLGSFTLAQSLAAAGRKREALATYQEALRVARNWRQEIVPSPEIELLANIGTYQIASAYASLAAELSEREGNRQIAWRAMLAIEQARDQSVRSGVDPKLAEDPEYQETLAQWRAQQFWSFANAGGRRRPEGAAALAIEAKLRALENRHGAVTGARLKLDGRQGLERLQAALGPQDALMSFSLGDGRSWLWAVTRNSFEQIALPGREKLAGPLAEFCRAVRHGSPGVTDQAQALHTTLFGQLSGTASSRRRWLLSMDDALLEVPLAALRCGDGAQAHYLIQDHVLAPLASALTLVEKRNPARPSNFLLGVGDPVYNLADERWRGGSQPAFAQSAALQLPRLPGSSAELERIGRQWNQAGLKSHMLTGLAATPERFSEEMETRPKVIHLAVHLIQEEADSQGFVLMRNGGSLQSQVRAQRPSEMFLMFSLRPDGQADGLTARSVGAYRLPGSLVVMSGCGTGLGTHQPGAGLAGFFKSWIAAGASGVVGTLWSIPDDASALFDAFYASIRKGTEPPAALREAQLALLARGGWNSRPSFWSAWTTVGRN